MHIVRRSEERERCARGKQDRWQTFPPGSDADPLAHGFGSLALFEEDRLGPGALLRQEPTLDVEIVTYVREGAVAYRDSLGRSGVVNAGEFQCWNAGHHLRRSESNASRTEPAHVFRMFLRPSQIDGGPSQEQRRVSVAERRGGLRVVAASDARSGALRIHSDAVVCSSLLELGKHVVHELAPARGAWVHIVEGLVTLGELVLRAGDGAGISAERAVSLTAREHTELLLLDVSFGTSRRARLEDG